MHGNFQLKLLVSLATLAFEGMQAAVACMQWYVHAGNEWQSSQQHAQNSGTESKSTS